MEEPGIKPLTLQQTTTLPTESKATPQPIIAALMNLFVQVVAKFKFFTSQFPCPCEVLE